MRIVDHIYAFGQRRLIPLIYMAVDKAVDMAVVGICSTHCCVTGVHNYVLLIHTMAAAWLEDGYKLDDQRSRISKLGAHWLYKHGNSPQHVAHN